MKHKMVVYFDVRGGHTHLRIFTGSESSRGCAGNLCMTNEEFEAWKQGRIELEFKPEEPMQTAIVPSSMTLQASAFRVGNYDVLVNDQVRARVRDGKIDAPVAVKAGDVLGIRPL